MTSGREVYRVIEEQVREKESGSSALRARIETQQAKIRALSEQQEELYANLATSYLPAMDANSVKNTLREMRAEVQRIFDHKNKRRAELESLLSDTNDRRAKFTDRLHEIDKELEDKAQERDKIRADVNAELQANSNYIELKPHADQAQARLEQNKRRAQTFEEEANKKLAAYESDPLFMYLVRQQFGTDNQRGNRVVRFVDEIIARRVNYRTNKANYDFLKAMPDLMQAKVDEQQHELDGVVKQLAAMEEKAAAKYHLPLIMEEGAALGNTRQNLMQTIGQLDQQYTGFDKERSELDTTKGTYHREAIERLTSFLKGQDIVDLRTRAKMTPDPTDDGFVDKIDNLAQSIADVKKTIKGHMEQQSSYTAHLQILRKLEQEFTSRDWESSRSRFGSDFDIMPLLIGYLAGQSSHAEVIRQMDEHQHFAPRQTYSSSSSYSSSHGSSSSHSSSSSDDGGWSSSSSGGCGGGDSGFSSGGGFGGGGSSTGGGF